jgi:hypothetical protein
VGDCSLERKLLPAERVLLDQLILHRLAQFMDTIRQDACFLLSSFGSNVGLTGYTFKGLSHEMDLAFEDMYG